MHDDRDKLIGLVYEGAADERAWEAALHEVAGLVNAAGVGFGLQDSQAPRFRDLAAHGIDRALDETYRRLSPDNRMWREIARARGRPTGRMAMARADFERSALFAGWFAPQGFHSVIGYPALFEENAFALVVAFRSKAQGNFESSDVAALGDLAGHFGRALRLRLERERIEDELGAVNSAMEEVPDALFLVDSDLRLRHANAAGRRLLAAGEVLRLRRGRLALSDTLAADRLARHVREGRGGETPMGLRRRPDTILKVHPRGAALDQADDGLALVRIADPDGARAPLTAALLSERLGLSRRQAEVVAALAAGATEVEAAERLRIGAPTVHTYLRRVYQRLDLSNRAELLALLATRGFDTSRRAEKSD